MDEYVFKTPIKESYTYIFGNEHMFMNEDCFQQPKN